MTKAQLESQLKELKEKLAGYEETGRIIPWKSYLTDMRRRTAIHNEEINLLLFQDCPRYWASLKKGWASVQEAIPSLSLIK